VLAALPLIASGGERGCPGEGAGMSLVRCSAGVVASRGFIKEHLVHKIANVRASESGD
jgi:hypothetical protein